MEQKNQRAGWIFVIVYLAYTSIYIARLNLSMASPGMIDANIIDAGRMGLLGGAFSTVYAIGRLIMGVLGDRKSPCFMICTGLILTGISNILIGFFPPFAGILLLWSVNAFAQSMLWSSVLCIVSSVFKPDTAKRLTPFLVTSVAVGNIAGILLSSFLIMRFGLAWAFAVPGGITLVLAALVLIFTKGIVPPESSGGKHIPAFGLLRIKTIRLVLLPAMIHGAIRDNISLWMAVYFMDRFGIDLKQSAYFVLFIPTLGLAARLLYPAGYKLFRGQEHRLDVLSFLLCAVFALPLCFGGGSPVLAAVCLSVLYAMVYLVNTSFLSMVPLRFADTGNVASVSGLLDFATYLGAGIGIFLYGYVIEYAGYLPMYLSWVVLALLSAGMLFPLAARKQENEQFN